jgi:putative RNA 2'-phosphotransferase
MPDLKRLSKFLAVVLRHKPGQFGVELDAEGYTDLNTVWRVVKGRYGERYRRDDLLGLLSTDDQGRYELTAAGRVRARYGHSVVPVVYPPVKPPPTLYHGTVADALKSIQAHGLQAGGRQYVHLSTTPDRAHEVAGRRGRPVLLTIQAQAAHDSGVIFHQPESSHYLVRELPAAYIVFPDE